MMNVFNMHTLSPHQMVKAVYNLFIRADSNGKFKKYVNTCYNDTKYSIQITNVKIGFF